MKSANSDSLLVNYAWCTSTIDSCSSHVQHTDSSQTDEGRCNPRLVLRSRAGEAGAMQVQTRTAFKFMRNLSRYPMSATSPCSIEAISSCRVTCVVRMTVKTPSPNATPARAWQDHTSGRLPMANRSRLNAFGECIRAAGYLSRCPTVSPVLVKGRMGMNDPRHG